MDTDCADMPFFAHTSVVITFFKTPWHHHEMRSWIIIIDCIYIYIYIYIYTHNWSKVCGELKFFERN